MAFLSNWAWRVSGYLSSTESEPRISGAPGLLSVTRSTRSIVIWPISPIFFEKRLCPRKSFQRENFSKSIFSFWNTFWTILNWFRPKKFFRKIFEKFSIFWSPIFRKKRLCLSCLPGENRWNWLFHYPGRWYAGWWKPWDFTFCDFLWGTDPEEARFAPQSRFFSFTAQQGLVTLVLVSHRSKAGRLKQGGRLMLQLMQLNVKVGRKTKERWVGALMELAGFWW